MGKRKLEIKLVDEKPKRHTVFTKRRQGLMKKAERFFDDSCSAGAVIVFSQAGNCFVYGHPVVETVLRRYVAAGIPEDAVTVTEAQWRICEELGKEGWSEMIQGLGMEEVVELLAEMEEIERKFVAAAAASETAEEEEPPDVPDNGGESSNGECEKKSAVDGEVQGAPCEI